MDRRFGENDPSMSIEERMLERFTRERQRASKGTTFNLEDEDELTHYGQSLSKLDDFDNVGLGLEDDDDDGAYCFQGYHSFSHSWCCRLVGQTNCREITFWRVRG